MPAGGLLGSSPCSGPLSSRPPLSSRERQQHRRYVARGTSKEFWVLVLASCCSFALGGLAGGWGGLGPMRTPSHAYAYSLSALDREYGVPVSPKTCHLYSLSLARARRPSARSQEEAPTYWRWLATPPDSETETESETCVSLSVSVSVLFGPVSRNCTGQPAHFPPVNFFFLVLLSTSGD